MYLLLVEEQFMRALFYLLASAFVVGTLLLSIGCNNGGGGGEAPPPPAVLPPACTVNCPVVTGPAKFVAVSGVQNAYYYNNFANAQQATMTLSGGYNNVLEEAMGVCNRQAYSGGLASCQAYMSGKTTILLDASSTTANGTILRIASDYSFNPSSWYTYSFPKFGDFILNLIGFPVGYNNQGYFNPMILATNIWPINNSQGFEIRAYGPMGSQAVHKLFQLQVPVGKLEDASFGFVLLYNNTEAARGTLVRYQ